ncbi:DUF305 domain-containing protein [soil metagenome]
MDTTFGQELAQQKTGSTQPRPQWLTALSIVTIAAVILMAGFALWLLLRSDTPADNSAEAGFARDMSMHHIQAVEMALITQERTEDPEIRVLATDIIITQTGQIGQMRGWLDAWHLPPNSADLPMTWMGHPVEGRMPGMASPEEVAQLRELPEPEMDALFLQLMIVHHQSGVDMAQAVLDRSDNSTVEFLAGRMVDSQQKEIDVMNDMLERRGSEPVTEEPVMDGEEEHGQH